ncbi:ankyrin repeat-containing domain protein, partial [Flagelloscypha sp. PMI_526]
MAEIAQESLSPSTSSPPGLCQFTRNIHQAVESRDLPALQSLLTRENVNQRLCSDTTVVFLVVASCRDNRGNMMVVLDTLRFLHELGADVNMENEDWPRHFSFEHEHPNNVAFFPDPIKWTPIIKAAYIMNEDLIKMLTSHGADIGQLDDEAVKLLVAQGPPCQLTADVHRAAKIQDMDILFKVLTPQNVNTRLCSGVTPLFLVIAECESFPSYELTRIMTILRGLVRLGANVNTDNEDWPRSSFSFDKHPHNMEKSASTSTKATLPATISGITPLMKAASLRDREIMEFLLENGADPTTAREDGQTATTILESAEKAKGKKPRPKKPKK